MTYTNGINSLQQLTGTLATSGSNGTNQAAVTNDVKPGDVSPSSVRTTSSVVRLDQASLSSASALVGQALSAPDVRSATVSALQDAIATGSYHVSSSAIADKLIASLLN